MWWPRARPAGSFRFCHMKLLIVRHGQSANNVIMHKINARRAKGEISGKEAEAEWLSDRVDDPTLTEEGLFEARQLASFYAPDRKSVV